MKCSWREGNKIQLLENGEQYYPAVFKGTTGSSATRG